MNFSIEKFSTIICFDFSSPPSFLKNHLRDEGNEWYHHYNTIKHCISLCIIKLEDEFPSNVKSFSLADIKHGFASKQDFMTFLIARSTKLSETPTFFSFILVCVFFNLVIQGIAKSLRRGCYKVANVASKCLTAAYYRQYVDVFQSQHGFEGLASYCEKLNEFLKDIGEESKPKRPRRRRNKLFNLPNLYEITALIKSIKDVNDSDVDLTVCDKKTLYDRDSLPLGIDPSEDIFMQLYNNPESKKNCSNKLLVNLNTQHYAFCFACKDYCNKYVDLVYKELGGGTRSL